MNDTPTPETDTELDCAGNLALMDQGTLVIPAELAQRLERERDEARGAFIRCQQVYIAAQTTFHEDIAAERALADRLAESLERCIEGWDDVSETAPITLAVASESDAVIKKWREARK
jgi:hypothetical protein